MARARPTNNPLPFTEIPVNILVFLWIYWFFWGSDDNK